MAYNKPQLAGINNTPAIDALTASDYAPVQGFVLAMGVLFVALNLFVDVLYTLIDPRMSLEH